MLMDDRIVRATGLSAGKQRFPDEDGEGFLDMEVGLSQTQKGRMIKILRSQTAPRLRIHIASCQAMSVLARVIAAPGSDDHYFAQSWGVFGLAYQSQIYEIGVLSRGEGHGIPLPSKESGVALAEGFESAMGEAAQLLPQGGG